MTEVNNVDTMTMHLAVTVDTVEALNYIRVRLSEMYKDMKMSLKDATQEYTLFIPYTEVQVAVTIAKRVMECKYIYDVLYIKPMIVEILEINYYRSRHNGQNSHSSK